MASNIQPSDLSFVVTLASQGSLSSTARELSVTKAAISKRLSQLESRCGVLLVNRSTRRMSLTPEGVALADGARRILADVDALNQQFSITQQTPRGLLRVNATLGFGRTRVAPLIARFVRKHPEVEVQLQLSVNPPALTDDAFDVCFRFGSPPEARVVARKLASNRRLICASPAYLERVGLPKTPAELARLDCIGIRQGDEGHGIWRFSQGQGARRRVATIKTRNPLSTNDGEIAVRWALDGLGLVMRSEWDVSHHLKSGRLVQVLPTWETPDADIHAVYPQRLRWSARVHAFVDFCAEALPKLDGKHG